MRKIIYYILISQKFSNNLFQFQEDWAIEEQEVGADFLQDENSSNYIDNSMFNDGQVTQVQPEPERK